MESFKTVIKLKLIYIKNSKTKYIQDFENDLINRMKKILQEVFPKVPAKPNTVRVIARSPRVPGEEREEDKVQNNTLEDPAAVPGADHIWMLQADPRGRTKWLLNTPTLVAVSTAT